MLSKKKAKTPDEKHAEHVHKLTAQEFPIEKYLTEEVEGYRRGLFAAGNGLFMRVYLVSLSGWMGEEKKTFRYEILSADADGKLKAEPREVYYDSAPAPLGLLSNTTNSYDLNCLRNKMDCLMSRSSLEWAENEAVKKIPAVSFRELGLLTTAEKRCKRYAPPSVPQEHREVLTPSLSLG